MMSYRPVVILIIVLLAAAFPASALDKSVKTVKPAPSKEEQAAPPVSVLSIIPAQGEPGMDITLSGNGFIGGISAFLGNVEVPTEVADARQLTFTLPDLAPGLYALFLKRDDGVTSRTYTFTVQPLKPVADDLSPDTIYSCSTGKERDVVISGRNFKEKSMTLFDGAAIKSRYLGPESLSFSVPQVAGGLHQVQVKNPGDTVSGALAVVIDSRPEITGVHRGEEYVNFYNLFIEGRNFQQNSTLVITEESSLDQSVSPAQVDVRRIRCGSSDATERERVFFSTCTKITYQRYPYSTVPKNFRLQIINPDGQESTPVSMSAP